MNNSNENLPLVYILIINFNSFKWLKECIPSILNNTGYKNYRIVIIDNNSSDGSLLWLKKKYSSLVIIKNYKNLGYAEGNNRGISYAMKKKADYFVLMNADTKVYEDWLKNIIKIGQKYKNIGILAPLVYEYDGKNIQANSILLMKKNISHIDSNINIMTRIEGCCMIIKREVVDKIGLLDPRYFLYWEESDWQRRAKYYGYDIVQVLDSKVNHFEKGEQKNKDITKYYYERNRFYYILKNPCQNFRNNIIDFINAFKKRMKETIKNKYYNSMLLVLRVLIWNIVMMPFTYSKRIKEMRLN